MIIDPSGKGGEAVLNNNQITMNAEIIVYGSYAASDENKQAVRDVVKNMQDKVNNSGLKMRGPDKDGETTQYDLKFNFTVKFVGNKEAFDMMKSNVDKNFDPKRNFVRIDEQSSINVGATNSVNKSLLTNGSIPTDLNGPGDSGDNSIYIPSRLLKTTAFVHEFFSHAFGSRSKTSHIMEIKPTDTTFSIRTSRFAKGVELLPSKFTKMYMDPETRELRLGLDEEKRSVLQEDIEFFTNYSGWKQDSGGKSKAWFGGSSNTFFNGNIVDSPDRKHQQMSEFFNTQDKNMTYDKAMHIN